MVRNSNHHFTQLNNVQAVHEKKIIELYEQTYCLPKVKARTDETYLYLNKYQPMIIFT